MARRIRRTPRRQRNIALWMTSAGSLILASALLAMFSGVTQYVPIGREVREANGTKSTILVLNDETGQANLNCPAGVLKIVVTQVAPVYPEPNSTSPTIGATEAGNIICTTEIRNGWWKISLPAATAGQIIAGWVSPETFAPVKVDLQGNLVSSSASAENAATVESVNAVLETVKAVQASQTQMLEILQDSQTQLRAAQAQAEDAQKKLSNVEAQVQAANARVEYLQRMLVLAAIAGGVLLVLGLLGMIVRIASGSGQETRTKTQTRYSRQMA